MFFEHRGTNPWVATERDHLSTFGLDVDTASYTLARSYIRRGQLPPPEAVRVEEFVNALSSDEPDPGRETFGIATETVASPFDEGRAFLRVGIRAKDVARRDRKPARLVFLVDVSGSMRMENRLELVKRGLQLLVERLDERDSIGIVAYGSSARVVLSSTPASEREAILEAVERLRPEGSTNLEAGLRARLRAGRRRVRQPGRQPRRALHGRRRQQRRRPIRRRCSRRSSAARRRAST